MSKSPRSSWSALPIVVSLVALGWLGPVGPSRGQVTCKDIKTLKATDQPLVSYAWEDWLAQGGGRTNPADNAWLNQTFTFYDENKKQATIAIKDLLDIKKLGYVYNHPPTAAQGDGRKTPEAKAVEQAPVTIASARFKEPVKLGLEPVSVTMKLTPRGQQRMKQTLAAPRLDPFAFRLLVDGVTYSAEEGDSSIVAYINLPKDAKLKKGHNPDENAFYASMYTPFGPVKNLDLPLNVTKGMERVSKMESWNPAELRVTLVRHWFSSRPITEGKTQLTVKGLRLQVFEE